MAMNPKLLRPRASGFNPKSISGLAVWLDGSDASTLTFNGSAVSQWADKSGNGRNATQATALNQPTTSTINGKGAILFDGSSDGLVLGDLSAAFPTAATGFWVHTKHSGANTGSYMVASTRNNDGWWRFGGGGSYLGVFRNARLSNVAINLEPAALNCVSVLSSASTYEVYVQGAKVHTAAASYAGGDNHVIGAGKVPLDYYLLASVGEVLYYNRALSADEVAKVHGYLSAKWGVSMAPQVANLDAQDWVNRVYANGGTVSASTASAVNTFCNAIDAAGIRSLIYRANLFCGSGLNAALVPLYRGPSRTGTQYGNTTDTNNGPFVSGDYVETGAGGGLTSNGTSKYLNTGFKADTLGQTDRHLSMVGVITGAVTSKYFIGMDNFGCGSNAFWGIMSGSTTATLYMIRAQSAAANSTSFSSTGGYVLVSGNGSAAAYADGVATVTGPAGAYTAPNLDIYTHALNRCGSPGDYTAARLKSYSIGAAMTAGQVTSFYNAMLAFQTALSRA